MTGIRSRFEVVLAWVPALALAFVGTLGTSASAADVGATPDQSGGFMTRPALTGDWGGARSDLAAKGVTIKADLTQVGQSVVSGGKHDETWKYGGRGNVTGNVDTQKLGLWPGGSLTVEVEGNWENSVNGLTGAFMPANANQLFPVSTGNNFNVPQVSFAQFVSPYAGFFAGKLDTSSGDMNEFAHGKGGTQFLNVAFNITPIALMTVPYSTLGSGVIVLPTKDPHEAILNASVMQANGTASEPGFDELNVHNLTFAGEGRVRTGFFGRTGHQLVSATYSNRTYNALDQRLGFVLENQRLVQKSGSWNVGYNFDQYVYEPEKGAGRGIGVFGRFGASDGNPNLVHYFYSLGIGGRGLIGGRPDDRFGIGYYYADITSPTFQNPQTTLAPLRDEWGFEAFYDVAITPWLELTPDVQVIGPSQKRTGQPSEDVANAVVLGFRVRLVF